MNNSFGNRLKSLRKSRSITQSELAETLDVTQQTVGFWENGVSIPSVETIIKAAKYFGVTIDYLLCVDDRTMIDITGLNEQDISVIQAIISYIRKSKK